jgi:enoyl-[acyl-carrier protein] reductase II
MGTRFVCSEECIAHASYKEKILRAHDRSTVVTGQSMGNAMRCLQNKLTRQFLEMEKTGAPSEEMDMLGRGRVYKGLIQGDVDEGSLLAGQIAGMISDIKPVRAIIADILAEAETTIARLQQYGRGA